jgi:anaerobic selenocysteine-containing dehydrogenase
MAEYHPVGFQWVMAAKARGTTVIHMDPRFTRTSAVADLHLPLQAGSDIAFLGGIVNYILQNEKYFHEYVLAYTNAATILREDFRDVDYLNGVFSGYDPESGTYDTRSWDMKAYWSPRLPAPESISRAQTGIAKHHSGPGWLGTRWVGMEPGSLTPSCNETRPCSIGGASSRCSSVTLLAIHRNSLLRRAEYQLRYSPRCARR